MQHAGGLTGYDLKQIERHICEDERTAELGVQLSVHGGRVFVQGGVASARSRDQVLAVVAEHCPDAEIVDGLTIAEDGLGQAPTHREEIR